MNKGKQDRNLWLAANAAIALIIIFFLLVPLLLVMFTDESVVFRVLNIAVSVLTAIIIRKLISTWLTWVVMDQCDFESYRLYQEKALRMKRNRNNAKLYLSLLQTYLVLGRQNECQKVIDELNRLQEKLSDLQKINLQLLYIDYLSVEKGYPALKEEIEKAAEAFSRIENIRQTKKDRIQYSITIRKVIAEEQWEAAIDHLKNSRKSTVFEEVNYAFILGICYNAIKDQEQAAREFEFVREWGGNTKYVSLADDLLAAMPSRVNDNEGQKRKPEHLKDRPRSIAVNLLTACLIVLATLFANYNSLYGSSIEEIYRKRYVSRGEEVTMLYSEKTGGYEMAVLRVDEKIVYCLFQESDQTSGTRYRMLQSFRTECDSEDYEAELERIERLFSESESELYGTFYQENERKQSIWIVITGFYKKSNVFWRERFPCIGISYHPEVENVKVNGQYLDVERLYISGEEQPVYLWRTGPFDLNEEILIEYEEKAGNEGW